MSINTFNKQIAAFNQMYDLPASSVPTRSHLPDSTSLLQRLRDFKLILAEELDEVQAIIDQVTKGEADIDVLTSLADWLGDIQVYCASEMTKFGLDNQLILDIIMASNMSKLGIDGKPLKDNRGKVLKGPNYWKPEPQIRRYIEATIRQSYKL